MQNYLSSERQDRVYLDYNATTPHAACLKNQWTSWLSIYGNPSSIHQDSRWPKTLIREARQKIARHLNCSPLEIIFNSGASEGNNSVLKSVWATFGKNRPEMLISQVEHPSVVKTAEYLTTQGAIIHWIPVNRSGQIDLNFIDQHLSDKTSLVSVMFANNETGTIFPIQQISQKAHAHGAFMHSDCVQILGKHDIQFTELQLDYATFSAHKFYSLKGTGFVYVKKTSSWIPLIHGGGQERGRRGGTENVLGIAVLHTVLDLLPEASIRIEQMKKLRDSMESRILSCLSDVSVTAIESERLGNTSSLVIAGVDGETLLMSLDLKGFSVSTGAACSSGNPEPSPVLLAMGLTRNEAQSSLRVSLGWETTEEQIVDFVNTLAEVVQKLRQLHINEKVENVSEKSK